MFVTLQPSEVLFLPHLTSRKKYRQDYQEEQDEKDWIPHTQNPVHLVHPAPKIGADSGGKLHKLGRLQRYDFMADVFHDARDEGGYRAFRFRPRNTRKARKKALLRPNDFVYFVPFVVLNSYHGSLF